jgi:iron complex outermembrane receptor protein
MFYGLANLGQMETEGYDLGVKYKLPELPYGQFRIDWQSTYTAKYDEAGQNSKGDNITIGNVGAPGIFRLRSNLSLNWELGNWGANFTSRYYSGMKESCISLASGWCDKPDNYANGEKNPLRLTGANTFHDLQVSYKAPWKGTVAIGANNVFNHSGSLQYSAPNSDYAYYGAFDIGRFIYVKYTQRF